MTNDAQDRPHDKPWLHPFDCDCSDNHLAEWVKQTWEAGEKAHEEYERRWQQYVDSFGFPPPSRWQRFKWWLSDLRYR